MAANRQIEHTKAEFEKVGWCALRVLCMVCCVAVVMVGVGKRCWGGGGGQCELGN